MSGTATILVGNARQLPLADKSVQCVVTSPPYWGLRKYAGAQEFVWDGDAACEHVFRTERYYTEQSAGVSSAAAFTEAGASNAERVKAARWRTNSTCACGAWLGALGLEPTPELYVQHLVQVFAEVWRVLRDDGTVWLNLGDCSTSGGRKWRANDAKLGARAMSSRPGTPTGLKAKDLVGIPWMAAFALRSAGWYLRDEIIWAKAHEFCPSGVVGSTMPESVKDRCTRAHEKLFLLTKSPRYYFDLKAATVAGKYPAGTQAAKGSGEREGNRRPAETATYSGTRQLRNVWHISPRPFKGAHFATFPPQLVTPCVQIGSRPGDVVLDPFSGSGTTAMVARDLRRVGIGVDISVEYAALAGRRLRGERIDTHTDKQAGHSRRHAGFNARWSGKTVDTESSVTTLETT